MLEIEPVGGEVDVVHVQLELVFPGFPKAQQQNEFFGDGKIRLGEIILF